MKYLLVLTILFVLFVPSTVEAMLSRWITVTSIEIDPNSSDVLYVRIEECYSLEAAISRDGGETFTEISPDDIPEGLTNDLDRLDCRYLHVPDRRNEYTSLILLRSDDDGETWTETSLDKFLRLSYAENRNQELEEAYSRFEHLRPEQTWMWHAAFGFAVVAQMTLLGVVFRKRGLAEVASFELRILITMFMVWLLFMGMYYDVQLRFDQGIKDPFYGPRAPVPQLTPFAFIAAKPWALIPYLLFMWPILPGSSEVLQQMAGDSVKRQRRRYWFVLLTGIAFVAAHPLGVWAACAFSR